MAHRVYVKHKLEGHLSLIESVCTCTVKSTYVQMKDYSQTLLVLVWLKLDNKNGIKSSQVRE